ncbi:hypothetical protein BT69DRAFT_824630 [Atractiella rhizophila]|nr:hypothetical protein BT69DRAFT_824630 [Atractiella rhizophila]
MMFGSDGFAESTSTAPPPAAPPTNIESEVAEDDSDAERDVVEQRSYVAKPLPRLTETYKFIPILHTCYSTYKAVLWYLFSGSIDFATLSSIAQADRIVGADASYAPKVETSERKNLKRKRYVQDAPRDIIPKGIKQGIIPVSPKSVFKIAHAYEIGSLKTAALKNLESQLTPHNVLLELLSDCSNTYEEVRGVHIRYLVKHWVSLSPYSY